VLRVRRPGRDTRELRARTVRNDTAKISQSLEALTICPADLVPSVASERNPADRSGSRRPTAPLGGVANMPGSVPRTSTFALTNSAIPYVLLVDKGWQAAGRANATPAKGLTTHDGALLLAGGRRPRTASHRRSISAELNVRTPTNVAAPSAWSGYRRRRRQQDAASRCQRPL
jgi:hypothetical protein